MLDKVSRSYAKIGVVVSTLRHPRRGTTNSQEADNYLLKSHAGGDTRAMQNVVPKVCPLSAHVLGVYEDVRGRR